MARTHRPLTVAALLLSMFMSAMETTVVATAMPTVIADLGGIHLYGWVGAAYALAMTVSTPIFGKIADLFGRKRVMLFGTALFLAGSTASGFAGSIGVLIVARAFQGLGAGAMQPVALTVIGDIFTIEERGRVQGLFGSVWAAAGIAGPLLGGAIVHVWSWPWVFWINIPFGIGSMLVLSRAFHEEVQPRAHPELDLTGGALLAGGSLLLLLGASQELPLLTFPMSAIFFVLLVMVERRAREPVLPLDMFSRRSIAVAAIASTLMGASMLGSILYAPLFVQGVMGMSPAESGASVAPMLVGWPIASALTSRLLMRTGFRPPVWLGSILAVASLLWFALILSDHPTLLRLEIAMFIFGLGLGFANTALVIAVQSAVPWNQRGVATAACMFARSMGGALAAGWLGAMLASRLEGTMPAEQVSMILNPHLRATDHPASVETIAALSDALLPLFWVIFALGVVNLLVVAFYPKQVVVPLAVQTDPSI